jgi:hypothetical protein
MLLSCILSDVSAPTTPTLSQRQIERHCCTADFTRFDHTSNRKFYPKTAKSSENASTQLADALENLSSAQNMSSSGSPASRATVASASPGSTLARWRIRITTPGDHISAHASLKHNLVLYQTQAAWMVCCHTCSRREALIPVRADNQHTTAGFQHHIVRPQPCDAN